VSTTSTSTLGLPRLSRICRPITRLMAVIAHFLVVLSLPDQGGAFRAGCHREESHVDPYPGGRV
jgi:hypothetical protein